MICARARRGCASPSRRPAWASGTYDMAHRHDPFLAGTQPDARLSARRWLDPKVVQARYFPGDEQKVRLAGEKAVKAGERYFEAEFRFFWPDGSLRWLIMRAEIMFDPDGKVRSVLGAVLDITDRKEAEERQVFLMRELDASRAELACRRARDRGFDAAECPQPQGGGDRTDRRIGALADVHTLLSNSAGHRADLREIAAAIVEPYRTAEDRIGLYGAGHRAGGARSAVDGAGAQRARHQRHQVRRAIRSPGTS